MISYYVRTTGQRKFSYNLDYEKLIDKENKPLESFISQLEYISNENSVLLEDDLILCKDFKEKIEDIINKYPNEIINFYTSPHFYFTTDYNCFYFTYNQCTYYPKDKTKLLVKELKRLYDEGMRCSYETLTCKALRNLKITHIAYRPCLVQHIDNKSLISNRSFGNSRRTPYFIDYLEELNIKYEDANKIDNIIKLEEHLEEHFKDILKLS